LSRITVIVLALLALAGCAPVARPSACLLPGQTRLVIAKLFFGRDVPGRGPVTDAEWSDFVARVVSANFPDGFTVVDAEGEAIDQQTDRLLSEPTKILIAAADPDSEPATRIATVINAYRREFHQQSVGVVTDVECGAF
jgi:hypothetical protein